MLNEHAAGQGSGHLLVIEYNVLQHVLAIILCLKKLEPPEEGKSIEFPRKHAILADCTTIDYSNDNMAKMSVKLGNFEETAELYKQNSEINHLSGDFRGEPTNRANLANCYARMHKFDMAISLHIENRKAALEVGDSAMVLKIDTDLAMCFRLSGQYDISLGIQRRLWREAVQQHEQDEQMLSSQEFGWLLWTQVRVDQGVATPTSTAATIASAAARADGRYNLSATDKERLSKAIDWFEISVALALARSPERDAPLVRLDNPHHHVISCTQLHLASIAYYSGIEIRGLNALAILQVYLKKMVPFAKTRCDGCLKKRADIANSITSVPIDVPALLKCSGCGVVRSFCVCCSVLQCVAVRCSVLQCAAVYCSVSQCVAVCYSVLQCVSEMLRLRCNNVCLCVLQCVAVCCRVLHCVAVPYSVLQCVAVCCIALHCVALCCNVFLKGSGCAAAL